MARAAYERRKRDEKAATKRYKTDSKIGKRIIMIITTTIIIRKRKTCGAEANWINATSFLLKRIFTRITSP
jgi:hypothetical protein